MLIAAANSLLQALSRHSTCHHANPRNSRFTLAAVRQASSTKGTMTSDWKKQSRFPLRYLGQEESIKLDEELFSDDYGFGVEQLMELAGLSIAQVINQCYPRGRFGRLLICCGPGNNGGDGMVAARHLRLMGYEPHLWIPKTSRRPLLARLEKQASKFDVQASYGDTPPPSHHEFNLLVDAVFGFSYKPPNTNPQVAACLRHMHKMSESMPLISIDIPSGWHVETGPANIEHDNESASAENIVPTLQPECLISLTAPKLCARNFTGKFHYLGSRFVPDAIINKYRLYYPEESLGFEPILLSNRPPSDS